MTVEVVHMGVQTTTVAVDNDRIVELEAKLAAAEAREMEMVQRLGASNEQSEKTTMKNGVSYFYIGEEGSERMVRVDGVDGGKSFYPERATERLKTLNGDATGN